MSREAMIEAMCAAFDYGDLAPTAMARVLDAVKPHIRAQALRDAADECGHGGELTYFDLQRMADEAEKGE